MRTMLLSFKADVFQRVVSGKKIYEHRKVFPDEPIRAYLYISHPVKAVGGIMLLSHKVSLSDWKIKYQNDKKTVERIDKYLKQHKYAMQIDEFQNTNQISLMQLRNDVPGFIVPQMYYFIDDSVLLEYLERNLKPVGNKIKHDFKIVPSTKICIY